MASIWEKAISILAGNLNSGRSYLITAVHLPTFSRDFHKNMYDVLCRTRFEKNISWKRRCQKRKKKNAPSDKKLHSIVATLRKKGKNFCLHCNFFVLFWFLFFCKHFIKSTWHEFPGSKSRCKSNKTRKLFGVSTLRIYCKFCRRKTIISDTTM